MLKLLDCTLRDGGYVNNWEFGKGAIENIVHKLEETNVDVLEIGFLKDESYDENRTVFNEMEQIVPFIKNKKRNIQYAAMIEAVNPISLDKLMPYNGDNVDIIRVIIWKSRCDENGQVIDALQESFRYCQAIVEKGYKLCVQPARVEQYSDEEFVEMLKLYQKLNPMAIYIVDSWGTQSAESVMHYVNIANEVLDSDIAIGYHGHNNLMQAMGTAVEFINSDLKRNIIVDASVYGIGRGAGNLNLELFAKYLNEERGCNYEITPIIEIYENYIKQIYDRSQWGYSMPYYLTAKYHCNPNYGEFYGKKKQLTAMQIEKIFKEISKEDKVIFSEEKAEKYLSLL